jgi:trimethylamine--corrinoid protein Co-methyltransferase
MERYENAFYQPLVSDWQNFENWQDSGSQAAAVRANGIYKQLLADYEEPPMDAAVRAELDDFVDRRIAAGGADQDA